MQKVMQEAMQCSKCQAALSSPLVCVACGHMQQGTQEQNPFIVLGLNPCFELTLPQLEQAYEDLLIHLHPDLFTQQDTPTQALSQQYSALLMQAKQDLEQPFKRVLCLLGLYQKKPTEKALQPDKGFLIKMFGWQEQLEQALKEPEAKTLQTEITQELARVHTKLNQLCSQLVQNPKSFNSDQELYQVLGQLKFLQNAQLA